MKKLFLILLLVTFSLAELVYLYKPRQIRLYDTDKKISILVVADLMPDSNLSIKRRPAFHYDPDLPHNLQSNKKCYYKKHIDRGHIVADRWFDFNKSLLYTTYEYTNIIPEYPRINRVVVAKIERKIDEMKCNYLKVVIIRIYPSDKRISPNCSVIPKKINYHFYCDDKEYNYTVKQEVK